MKKLLFSLLAALLIPIGAAADDTGGSATLNVNYKDGTQTVFLFVQHPAISYDAEGKAWVVTTDEGAQPFAENDIESFTVTLPVVTAIDDVKSQPAGHIYMQGGTVCLTGFAPGQQVSVYTAGGQLFRQHKANEQGNLQIGLGGLQRGTYIIQAGKTSYKIVK